MVKRTVHGGPPAAHAIEHLADTVHSDAALLDRGRFVDLEWLWEIGGTPYHVRIQHGFIAELIRGPVLMRPWAFAIRGPVESWERFWAPVPKPGYHDLFAMTSSGRATVEGDLQPLMSNLRYFKDVLAAPRTMEEH